MTLQKWIQSKGGYKKVAKLLGVSPMATYWWLNGTGLPKAQHMRKIVKISKGKVSYKEMIEPYFASKDKFK